MTTFLMLLLFFLRVLDLAAIGALSVVSEINSRLASSCQCLLPPWPDNPERFTSRAPVRPFTHRLRRLR